MWPSQAILSNETSFWVLLFLFLFLFFLGRGWGASSTILRWNVVQLPILGSGLSVGSCNFSMRHFLASGCWDSIHIGGDQSLGKAYTIRFLVDCVVLILYPLEVCLYAWKRSIPHVSFYIMFIKAHLGMKRISRCLESPIIATPWGEVVLGLMGLNHED